MSDDLSGRILRTTLYVVISTIVILAAWYAFGTECERVNPGASWWYCWLR